MCTYRTCMCVCDYCRYSLISSIVCEHVFMMATSSAWSTYNGYNALDQLMYEQTNGCDNSTAPHCRVNVICLHIKFIYFIFISM